MTTALDTSQRRRVRIAHHTVGNAHPSSGVECASRTERYTNRQSVRMQRPRHKVAFDRGPQSGLVLRQHRNPFTGEG